MLKFPLRFVPASNCLRHVKVAPAIEAIALAAFLLTVGNYAQAEEPVQARTHKTLVIPSSSLAKAGDEGVRAHTNVRYIDPGLASPDEAPPFPGLAFETPASLACLYHVVRSIPGCNPNVTTNTPSGGSQTIAIVDAFDDPTAPADLAAFSAQFGLPLTASQFQVVFATGANPGVDPTGGWEIEESLDIEYAHAMAPGATIFLVEANSNQLVDLFAGVQVASNLVACGQTTTCPANSKGKGEVSMSWGGPEFAQETSLDSFFTTPGVVYFAAAGDNPGVSYPCSSPNVVCAGGTSTARNENTDNFIAEITWQDAGGGISAVEPTPSYQAGLRRELGGFRGVPDISADSNPNTGVWILDTNPVPGPGWYIVGGTSVASPLLASIVNATSQFAPSSTAELTAFYDFSGLGTFNDIVFGACGLYSGTFASIGWDQCTGLGSPRDLDIR